MEEQALVATAPDNVTLGTLRADGPGALVQGATEIATHLAKIIESRHLYNDVQGKKFVRVEGWTTLAALLGCLPREVSNKEQPDGGYVATVELVRMDDERVISRATAECGVDESRWAKQPRYARRSMAATRATSKVCRVAFSWVMSLSGYEVTPAEEIGEHSWTNGQSSAKAAAKTPEVPFGKNAGTPIDQLTDHQLSWYIKAANENLNSEEFQEGGDKYRFRKKEEAWLEALNREAGSR